MIRRLILFVVLVAVGFVALRLFTGSGFRGNSRSQVMAESNDEPVDDTPGVAVPMGGDEGGQAVEWVYRGDFQLSSKQMVEGPDGVRYTVETQRIKWLDSEPDPLPDGSPRQHVQDLTVDFFAVGTQENGEPISIPRMRLTAAEAWVELAPDEEGKPTVRSDRQMDMRGVRIKTLPGSNLMPVTLEVGQISAWSRARETYFYTGDDEAFTLEVGGKLPLTVTGSGLRVRLPGEQDLESDQGRANLTVVKNARITHLGGGDSFEGFSAQCEGRLTYSEDLRTGAGTLQLTDAVRMAATPVASGASGVGPWTAIGDQLTAWVLRPGRGEAADLRQKLLIAAGLEPGPSWQRLQLTGQPAALDADGQRMECSALSAVAGADGMPMLVRAAGAGTRALLPLGGSGGGLAQLTAARRVDLLRPGALAAPVYRGFGFPSWTIAGMRQRQSLHAVGPTTLEDGQGRNLKAAEGLTAMVRVPDIEVPPEQLGSWLWGRGEVDVLVDEGTPTAWRAHATEGFTMQRVVRWAGPAAPVVETLTLNRDPEDGAGGLRRLEITQGDAKDPELTIAGTGVAIMERRYPLDAITDGGVPPTQQLVDLSIESEEGDLTVRRGDAAIRTMDRWVTSIQGGRLTRAEAWGSPCRMTAVTAEGNLAGIAERILQQNQGLLLRGAPDGTTPPTMPELRVIPTDVGEGTNLLAVAPFLELQLGPDPLAIPTGGAGSGPAENPMAWIEAYAETPPRPDRLARLEVTVPGKGDGGTAAEPSTSRLTALRWQLVPWTLPPTAQLWQESLLPGALRTFALHSNRTPRLIAHGAPELPLRVDFGAEGSASGEHLIARLQGPDGVWGAGSGLLTGAPATLERRDAEGLASTSYPRQIRFRGDRSGAVEFELLNPNDESIRHILVDPEGLLPGGSPALLLTTKGPVQGDNATMTVDQPFTVQGLQDDGSLDPGGMSLAGDTLRVERDEQTGQVLRLVASGHVDLDTPQMRAKGERLELDPETGWASVTAAPGERVWIWVPGLMPASMHSARANYRTKELRAWRALLGEQQVTPDTTLQSREVAPR